MYGAYTVKHDTPDIQICPSVFKVFMTRNTVSLPIYSNRLVFCCVQEEYRATSYELSADGLYLLIGYDLQAVCIMTVHTVNIRV
jgi:hypothetical protein